DGQLVIRRSSIRGSRLRDDAPDSHADAAPRPPRTTGRTRGHGNRQRSPDPAVARPSVAPSVRVGYSTHRANGPAGIRPRAAHRARSLSRLAADPATRCAILAPTRPEHGNTLQ